MDTTNNQTAENQNIKKEDPKFTHLFFVSRLIVWVVGISALYLLTIHKPKPLKTDYNTDLVIMDNIDVFTAQEEEMLRQTFLSFQTDTGITPAIVTVSNDNWQVYTSLETFSKDLYTHEFKDERHWLFVYSNNLENTDEWYWQDRIGTEIEPLLSTSVVNGVKSNIQKYLTERENYSVAESFNTAFCDIMPGLMNRDINWFAIIVITVVDLIGIAAMLPPVIKSKKYLQTLETQKEQSLSKT